MKLRRWTWMLVLPAFWTAGPARSEELKVEELTLVPVATAAATESSATSKHTNTLRAATTNVALAAKEESATEKTPPGAGITADGALPAHNDAAGPTLGPVLNLGPHAPREIKGAEGETLRETGSSRAKGEAKSTELKIAETKATEPKATETKPADETTSKSSGGWVAVSSKSKPSSSSTTSAPAPAEKKSEPSDAKGPAIGFDGSSGKTFHNVLRDEDVVVEKDPTPLRLPLDIDAKSTNSKTAETKTDTIPTSRPLTESSKPAVATTKPPVGVAKPVEKSAPATTETPKKTATIKPEIDHKPQTVITDQPARTPTPSSAATARPNSMFNSSGDEVGKKATVDRRPADLETKKLFESTEAPPPLTPEQEVLRKRVQNTLASYYQNWTLNTRDHTPWEVMHAIIAYGVDTRLNSNGRYTTAMGHLLFSGVSGGQSIVSLKNGRPYMQRGVGVQGHSGQFLAILAQSHLQRDYPLHVSGHDFTLEDLIAAEQYDCESGTELTFKLIGLMHYLPSDATWTNFQGQTWSLDRLVREEIVQPVRGAACGGTHRLMGLAYAVRKREQRGEPVTGIYEEARKYLEQYHKYTFGLQNPDGSFSTAWFVRRESRLDLDRRLQTTGHILEWLCFSLSDEQLRDPRVTRAVRYVTDLLLDESGHQWEIGHLGHALHALQLYNERIYNGPMRSYERMVTRKPTKTVR